MENGTLKLKFKEKDDLDERLKKSLKFLNKIYGVSNKRVEQILKRKEQLSQAKVSP